jgi:hypothetical protein
MKLTARIIRRSLWSTFGCAALVAALIGVAVSAGMAQTTVSFQNGIGGYTGAYDHRIGPGESDNVDGSTVDTDTTSFYLDGGPTAGDRKDLLIRFDNIIGPGAIPAGAIILNATLDLRTSEVTSNNESTGAYNVYRLAQPFNSSSTFEGDFGGGMNGVEPNDGEADWILSSYDNMGNGQWNSAVVTRAVQSWVNGAPNYGLGVASDFTTDGWSVHGTGAATADNHPRLSVTYTTNPNVALHEFQQGLDGYSGTKDVLLSGNPEESSVDGSTADNLYLDGSDGESSYDDPYMIRFDDLFDGSLQLGDPIVKAELVLVSGPASSSDSGGPFTVHQLMTGFTTASEHEDFAGDVDAMLAAGEIGEAVGTVEDVEEAEVIIVDVTSIVRNWSNGDTNHGIYIGAGTSNGWQIYASGATDSNFAPMLRVVSVPEPSVLTLVFLLGFVATWIGRRR